MPSQNPTLISDIRFVSRDLVRQLGLMNQTVAGTNLPISTVHAIIEIGRSAGLSSKQLSNYLKLEKSTISRLVRSLVNQELVEETRDLRDQRIKYLHLTQLGEITLKDINNFAHNQVSQALAHIDENSQNVVLAGLRHYSKALKISSNSKNNSAAGYGLSIHEGYTPTLLGQIIVMLQTHMSQHFNFGPAFEARITSDLAEFLTRLKHSRNNCWYGKLDEKSSAVFPSTEKILIKILRIYVGLL
jgi:DNA-binding MarR family transcriptional regulator